LAKIAVELRRALEERTVGGTAGQLTSRLLAQGDGWTVEDVVCTSGPQDRSFEERHSCFRVVVVCAGSFQYRSGHGRELMTPGALLLGNAGQCFECGHEHGAGDRCLSFGYAPDYFERLAADAGVRSGTPRFGPLRVPPLRALAPVVSSACGGLIQSNSKSLPVSWEELGVMLAAQAVHLAGEATQRSAGPPSTEARVTRAVRIIDRDPAAALTLRDLARQARLSPFHFLRTFERLTGLTPHQYVRRARLREAAIRLATRPSRILDVALACGFGDVSNFNRAFRSEFGLGPRAYRESNRRDIGKKA
jgi:AraC family transcriptional regulator